MQNNTSPIEMLTPAQLAFSKLLPYVKTQFPAYKIAEHNALISAYLEAIENRQLKRLMIFMPPRHGKTMLASEYFPAWYIGRNPNHQIIYTTYSFNRANDVGRKIRNQLIDPTHHEIFPDCKVSEDSKSAHTVSTIQEGNIFSVGIGGAITGRGAHLLIIDDPIKGYEDAESKNAQQRMRDWFDAVAYTRLMPDAAIILIMTRWNYYDLAGWLQEQKRHENWKILELPAIAEKDGDEIKRNKGDALWPEQYPIRRLHEIKQTVGTRVWNSLYQQSPIPDEGGMVNLDWFNRYDEKQWRDFAIQRLNGRKVENPFGITKIVCSWDTAFKTEQLNDPSSCTIWGIAKNDFYLLHVVNKKLQYPQLKREAVRRYEYNMRFGLGQVPVLIEDKGSGQSLIQDLKQNTLIPVIPIPAEQSKEIRLSEVTALIEAGRVHLPKKASWLINYETEMARFPFGTTDDDVDSTSQFLRWAGKPRRKKNPHLKYYK